MVGKFTKAGLEELKTKVIEFSSVAGTIIENSYIRDQVHRAGAAIAATIDIIAEGMDNDDFIYYASVEGDNNET